MRPLRSLAVLAALPLLAACVSMAEQEAASTEAARTAAPNWRAVDSATGQLGELSDLQQLAADFPDSGSTRRRLLAAQMEAEDIEGAMLSLEWLYERGYVFSEAGRQQIGQALATVDPGRLAERLRADVQPIQRSTVHAIVPGEAGLVETALVAGADEALMVSSVTQREIWFPTDGRWLSIAPPDADDLSGMVADPFTRTVWIASSNLDGSRDDRKRFNGLLKMRFEQADFRYVRAPDGVTISDLHVDTEGLNVAAEGVVYASDPVGGGIYRARAEDMEMSVLVPPGTFRSPQGLATSSDGSILYISDYRYGIALVDLVSGRVSRLAATQPMMLDGIDGLWRDGTRLIGIQNGTSPMRIVAIDLSPDGAAATNLEVLEQAHPEWTEPLGGSISGGALYYIATGQWDRYGQGGRLKDGMKASPTQVRRLQL